MQVIPGIVTSHVCYTHLPPKHTKNISWRVQIMKRPIRQHTFTKSNVFYRTWRWFSSFYSEQHTNCNNITLSPSQHISSRLMSSAQTRIPCRIKALLRAFLYGDHKLVANHVTGLPAFPWILMGPCYCLPVRCFLDITLSRHSKPISGRFHCRVM